jgi:hypothetical protein
MAALGKDSTCDWEADSGWLGLLSVVQAYRLHGRRLSNQCNSTCNCKSQSNKIEGYPLYMFRVYRLNPLPEMWRTYTKPALRISHSAGSVIILTFKHASLSGCFLQSFPTQRGRGSYFRRQHATYTATLAVGQERIAWDWISIPEWFREAAFVVQRLIAASPPTPKTVLIQTCSQILALLL